MNSRWKPRIFFVKRGILFLKGTYIMNNDTILLLKECDSGLKMAISSLDEVLDVIKNQKFKEICITSKNKHQKTHLKKKNK